MADTGFLFPGTAAGDRTITGGDLNWSSPDNIKADDGFNSPCFVGSASPNSNGLAASNFDFSGVSGTIDGIEVQIGDYVVTAGDDVDWVVGKLILADDSDGGTSKHTDLADWTNSNQTDQMGGASDLWDETINLSDVQDVDWGFFVGIDWISGTSVQPDIDFLQMKVYYTPVIPIITDVDTDETWTDGDTGLVITGTNFVS